MGGGEGWGGPRMEGGWVGRDTPLSHDIDSNLDLQRHLVFCRSVHDNVFLSVSVSLCLSQWSQTHIRSNQSLHISETMAALVRKGSVDSFLNI